MKKILFFIGVVFYIASCQYSSWESMGIRWFYRKDYKKAIHTLQVSISEKPSEKSYYFLGYSYVKLGDTKNAIDSLKKSIKLNNNYDAHCLLGQIYEQLNKNSQALLEFNNAIILKPHKEQAYVDRGLLQLAINNDATKALKDFKTALQLAPNDVNIKVAYSRALYCDEKYSQSIEYLDKCLKEHPNSPVILVELAWLWSACPNAKFLKQQQAFKTAKSLYEEYPQAVTLTVLAQSQASLCNFGNAITNIEKAINITKKSNDLKQNMHLESLQEIKNIYLKKSSKIPLNIQGKRFFMIKR